MTNIQNRFKAMFINSWWVTAVVLLCLIFYEQRLKEQEQLYLYFTRQLQSLEKEKKNSLIIQENLQLQINSQSDPAWIELMLMKGLGLAPEGQVKIFFDSTTSSP